MSKDTDKTIFRFLLIPRNIKIGIARIICVIIGIIVIGVAGEIGKKLGEKTFYSKHTNRSEIKEEIIRGFKLAEKQINQKAPIMIDSEIRIDSARVGPDAMFTYYNTFVNYRSDEIDIKLLSSDFSDRIIENVCNREEMRRVVEYGGIYSYSYSGNDGVKIFKIDIDKIKCQTIKNKSYKYKFLSK